MEETSQNSGDSGQPEQQGSNIPFEVRHFDGDNYIKVFHTHINVLQLFYSFLSQKGISLDPNELSLILNKYWEDYVKCGDSLGPVPDGSTCQHLFVRGNADKVGTMCGSAAKHWGVEGKPKCGTHKNSKASKAVPKEGMPSSSKSNPVFKYQEHKNSGIVNSQNLSSLQKSIKEQVTPVSINLTQNEHGIVYNTDTRIVFTQKEDQVFYAIGILNEDGSSYNKLTSVETYICYLNNWKWDPKCAVESEETTEHPLQGGLDPNNELVSKNNEVIQSKLDRFNQNNQ